tara:strand:+ start:1832 stop:2581 length:750 start_codon:yes stop_codon:yes gene_type:complete
VIVNRAWITGAGKGIGRALAKTLAAESWTVAVSARTVSDLQQLQDECNPELIKIFPLDVTNQEETVNTIEQIELTIGMPNLVIFNAGAHAPISPGNFTSETVRQLIEVNLMGVVNGLAEIIPRFVKIGGGHIAVVASLSGYVGLPTASAYGASKAALINMCESLQPELKRYNVRLTLINPGFVETPLTDKNDFAMPFLISAEDAAKRIIEGLNKDKFEITFPKRLAIPMKLLRLLPYKFLFALTKRMIR